MFREKNSRVNGRIEVNVMVSRGNSSDHPRGNSTTRFVGFNP
jgi:hypothetical protein